MKLSKLVVTGCGHSILIKYLSLTTRTLNLKGVKGISTVPCQLHILNGSNGRKTSREILKRLFMKHFVIVEIDHGL